MNLRFGLVVLFVLGALLPQFAFANSNNNDQAEVTVYLRVIGNGPHLLAPWDFDVEVTGADADPDEFEGNANGTRVEVDADTYFEVEVQREKGYHATYSGKCSGRIDEDDEERCFITLTQMLSGGALPYMPSYPHYQPVQPLPTMHPPVTISAVYVPTALPNTGFDPNTAPLIVYAIVLLIGSGIIAYPYARKAIAAIR